MKRIKTGANENCIDHPTSCDKWNGGDIEYLGICNGDSLNKVVWEIVDKLESITGDDLSNFDIDSLLTICNERAPLEISLLTILNVLKNNQICLRDYMLALTERINEINSSNSVKVNLKCFDDLDNLGNSLQMTREEFDQLVINELCDHENAIETLNSKLRVLQEQVDNINPHATVDEISFATCLDSGIKSTSIQLKTTAQAICDLQTATGSPNEIAIALAKVPSNWNTKFGLITGWDLTPAQWAEQYGNLLLVVANLADRVEFMEQNCCAIDCDDIKLGFTAVFNEDMDGIIIRFNFGTGTKIPSGLTDKGSTGTITDEDGVVQYFNLTISNNLELDVPLAGINTNGDLKINIDARIGSNTLLCAKCLNALVKTMGCGFCEITGIGATGSSAVIVYEDGASIATSYENPQSTTTTTTVGS